MFDYLQRYLKVNPLGCIKKTRPVMDGVKLSSPNKQSCSVCRTRTTMKFSPFSCEEFPTVGNTRGICKECLHLVLLGNQERSSSLKDDTQRELSDDDSEEIAWDVDETLEDASLEFVSQSDDDDSEEIAWDVDEALEDASLEFDGKSDDDDSEEIAWDVDEALEGASLEFDSQSDDDDSKEIACEDENLEDVIMIPTEVPADSNIRKSWFASFVVDNMKLVYLKGSLVEKLMEQEPECWERKVVGSYVRVKTDPRDYFRRNHFQLAQVQEIIKNSNSEVLMRLVSKYVTRDIPLSKLSDRNFTEEECEDLSQDVENCHLLRKPTVLELDTKAKELHEDITKHWIESELVRLQCHVDWANEKGRRSEMFEYLDQRALLEQECEQQRLLKQLPVVVPEFID